MALNSINTNIAAMAAQGNIGRASNMAGSSIARLSSGNRIVRASDDVAAMSAGTSLRTSVTTLKMALINTSQGSSLLQVADGALAQVTDILQRQKAIAVQAGSGSLTASERTFLNQEFQNLTQEAQRLAEKTNFNGVSLLDGVLTKTVEAVDVTSNATRATGGLSFTQNAAAGQLVVLNGVTFTAIAPGTPTATQFVVGATVQETLTNLATQLNASTDTRLSGHTYSVSGTTLNITAKSGGVGGSDFILSGLNNTSNGGVANQWINVAVAATNTAGMNAPDQGSFNNIWTVNLGVANTTSNVVSTVAAPPTTESGTTPIGLGTVLTGAIGLPAGAQTLYTAVAGHSLNDIVNTINAGSANHGFTAQIVGSSGDYNIRLRHANADFDNHGVTATGGDITVAGTFVTATRTQATATGVATAAATTIHVQASGLGGFGATGLQSGGTVGVGTIGNNLVTAQNQTKSVTRVLFPPITSANLATTLAATTAAPVRIDIGDPAVANEFVRFSFSRNSVAAASATEISIGATLEETIDNAASAINKYVGSGIENFDLNQIRAYRDGQSLVIESIDYGATTHLDNSGAATTANVNVALQNAAAAGVSLTAAALSNGTRGGISASNVTNADFIGKISGFTATHTGAADTVNISLTVGNHTYTANAVDTTPTANTTVRLSSENGGYLDIELSANQGTAVTTQSAADTFANRLNAAFATIDFYQTRDISSYQGVDPVVTNGIVTGSLLGTTVKMSGTDFSSVELEDISVSAPVGSAANATISFTVNGESYSSLLPLAKQLGANQTYKFTSASDSNKFIEFTTGNTKIELDTDAKAAAFQSALEKAFGVGEGNKALTFQVGDTSSDALAIGLKGITSAQLGTTELNVLTQESAAIAADAIDAAIDAVTSVRAEVGALQSRFNFAAANVESSIANQDSARGVLLDTDIAAESTAFSTAQVQLQAGISVLAQANLLPQNLLKLIG
jgi:flagellin